VAGAIDFQREPQISRETFDLVLDLRATPAFSQHALPQGYLRWDGRELGTLLQLRGLVGEFEKPRFFVYKPKLCAHSRNEKTGCTACIDVCSASAIESDLAAAGPPQGGERPLGGQRAHAVASVGAPGHRQQIKVNPNLCIGCGTCSTVCPTGAMGFAYPRASDQGVKLKTLLATYTRSGGKNAALLLHSQGAGRACWAIWGAPRSWSVPAKQARMAYRPGSCRWRCGTPRRWDWRSGCLPFVMVRRRCGCC